MVDVINTQLKSKLKAEKLLGTIDTYSAVEHNVITRIVPLVVKDFFFENSIQNVGQIRHGNFFKYRNS